MRGNSVVAWYRFRASFRRRWTGYLSVIVLIALTGGLAMASVAGARRTQSSYPTYLASTNPSTLSMGVFSPGSSLVAVPNISSKIRRLAEVTDLHTLDGPFVAPLAPNGAPQLNSIGNVPIVGSPDGYLTVVDRLTIVSGHLADPRSTGEVVLTPAAARLWGVRVGQTVPIGYYNRRQANAPGFGTPAVKPRVRIMARVVGIVAVNSEIVQDDVDRAYGLVFLTPAMLRQALTVDPRGSSPIFYVMRLRHGDRHLARVERELVGLVPRGESYSFHVTSTNVTKVELAVKPVSIALAAFGAIAALICLILSAQALGRQLRRDVTDGAILQALGAAPRELLVEALAPAVAVVVVGTLLAVLVAIALSPLAPLGPVRPFSRVHGVAGDWTVLGIGAGVIGFYLGAFCATLAWRTAPHRRWAGYDIVPRRSNLVSRAQNLGAPITATLGMHFALDPRRNRGDLPVRSVLVGAVLAVMLMSTTLTFASGLHTLVTHPALFGWNWSYELNPSSNFPPKALTLLERDHDVAAWSGVTTYGSIAIDGVAVPMLIMPASSQVEPPILSGHGLTSKHQIVLGNATLALLHRHVGQTVSVTYGSPSSAPIYVPPTRLTIVGTATFPAVGFADVISGHTSMGTGALVPEEIISATFREAITHPDPNQNGFQIIFVRLRSNVSPATGRSDMNRIAKAANAILAADPNTRGNSVGVLGPQRPAQIVNYRSIGSTPILLASGLAGGAVVALAVTLMASVRRRRRDLALLKTLGFTRCQVASTVAWQATIDGLVGALIGVPLGVVLGRELWTLFAVSINAVPSPTVPVVSIIIIAVGSVAVANIAAAWPGRRAAATPAALALRAE